MLIAIDFKIKSPEKLSLDRNFPYSLQGPKRFNLAPNYPNPFNPTTTIQYSLPKTGNVTLNIYNSSGQRVKNLIYKTLSPGNYKVTWDGTNYSEQPVSSGVYYY